MLLCRLCKSGGIVIIVVVIAIIAMIVINIIIVVIVVSIVVIIVIIICHLSFPHAALQTVEVRSDYHYQCRHHQSLS